MPSDLSVSKGLVPKGALRRVKTLNKNSLAIVHHAAAHGPGQTAVYLAAKHLKTGNFNKVQKIYASLLENQPTQ